MFAKVASRKFLNLTKQTLVSPWHLYTCTCPAYDFHFKKCQASAQGRMWAFVGTPGPSQPTLAPACPRPAPLGMYCGTLLHTASRSSRCSPCLYRRCGCNLCTNATLRLLVTSRSIDLCLVGLAMGEEVTWRGGYCFCLWLPSCLPLTKPDLHVPRMAPRIFLHLHHLRNEMPVDSSSLSPWW